MSAVLTLLALGLAVFMLTGLPAGGVVRGDIDPTTLVPPGRFAEMGRSSHRCRSPC